MRALLERERVRRAAGAVQAWCAWPVDVGDLRADARRGARDGGQQVLLELIPGVRVVAVDGSRAMLEQCEARLADRLDRVEIVHADLTKPLPVEGHMDAVISVAAFH